MKRNIIKKGEVFNYLTVIREVEPKIYKYNGKVHRHRMVVVKCRCNNIKIVSFDLIKSGDTKSCGCYKRQKCRRQLKHGLANSNFFDIYYKIISRCNNTNDKDFKDYGGRGIKCLWPSFMDFKNDMYDSYLKHKATHFGTNTRIDRIDNNGNYCKENCRWATHKQQARNRRSNHLLTFKGETMTLTEWSEKLNISPHLITSRILNYGWTVEEALTLPPFKPGFNRNNPSK